MDSGLPAVSGAAVFPKNVEKMAFPGVSDMVAVGWTIRADCGSGSLGDWGDGASGIVDWSRAWEERAGWSCCSKVLTVALDGLIVLKLPR